MSDTYVALLRGINVGGKNKMPMQALIGICSEAGCTNVQNYIQSGNVIFQAPPEIAEALPLKIATLITERFGYRIPVLLRTAIQLAEIVRSNPFWSKTSPKKPCTSCFLEICRVQKKPQALTLPVPLPMRLPCAALKSTCTCQTASKTPSSPTLILTQNSPQLALAETGKPSPPCSA
jgi:hypothetical protein